MSQMEWSTGPSSRHFDQTKLVACSVARVRGVGRAAEVLELFSVERPYWGPTEVAAEVGVAKSSAYELLRELARAGLVERMACGKYRLGWRLVGLARTMVQSNGHGAAVIPAAHDLARELGETVHLAALDRGVLLCVGSVVPAGGVAAPAPPVAADSTPLGQVLNTEHRGVLVGPTACARWRDLRRRDAARARSPGRIARRLRP